MFHNKKGFTLIEIIVSIALMSIVLMIVGTIIISTTGLLSKSTQSDLHKRAIDEIIDFVRSEIQYSSDVRVVKEKPKTTNEKDDWHCLYVKDDVLYRDDQQLFTKDFYSNGKLNMNAKCSYESNQRIDISYSLRDENEVLYSSRDTIVLFNLKVSDEIKNQGLYTQESQDLSIGSDGNGYRIYYNKYLSISDSKTQSTSNGTVEDIQKNMFYGNYFGAFIGEKNIQYKLGTIVWHDGFWWEALNDNDSSVPGKNFAWKCLDANFTSESQGSGKNKLSSGYEKNDIVIYNENYYQALKYVQWDAPIVSDKECWELLGSIHNSKIVEKVKKNKYSQRNTFNNDNVLKIHLPSNIDLTDPSHKNISLYEDKLYKINNIVKIKSELNNEYYDLYCKIGNLESISKPGSGPSSGWLKLNINYSDTSAYKKNDIIMLSGERVVWVIAQQDINQITNPHTDIYNSKTFWTIY